MYTYIVMRCGYDEGDLVAMRFDLESAKEIAANQWVKNMAEHIELTEKYRTEYPQEDTNENPIPWYTPKMRELSDVNWARFDGATRYGQNVIESHYLDDPDSEGSGMASYCVIVFDEPCPREKELLTLVQAQTPLIQNTLTRNETLSNEIAAFRKRIRKLEIEAEDLPVIIQPIRSEVVELTVVSVSRGKPVQIDSEPPPVVGEQLPTLFNSIVDSVPGSTYEIITRHGVGTEFEAVSSIQMDEETAYWTGVLVFKDPRFSPEEPEAPGIGLRYSTPGAASGVLAVTRAKNHYEQLVGIFRRLMALGTG